MTAFGNIAANSWVKRKTRGWLLEKLDKNTGFTIRFCDWAPTERTHMVKNRIPVCHVAVYLQMPPA